LNWLAGSDATVHLDHDLAHTRHSGREIPERPSHYAICLDAALGCRLECRSGRHRHFEHDARQQPDAAVAEGESVAQLLSGLGWLRPGFHLELERAARTHRERVTAA